MKTRRLGSSTLAAGLVPFQRGFDRALGCAEQKGQDYFWNTKTNKTQWNKPKVSGEGGREGGRVGWGRDYQERNGTGGTGEADEER